MINVLFVCLGNICRSPMAEAILRDRLVQEGLTQKVMVDSAGIGNWHSGEQPHIGTREVLEKLNVSYDGITSRQIKKQDWNNFHYIIAMDDHNIEDLKDLRGNQEKVIVAKLMDFVEEPQETNIPDPYFTNNFDYVYGLVNEGCQQLLQKIKQVHNL